MLQIKHYLISWISPWPIMWGMTKTYQQLYLKIPEGTSNTYQIHLGNWNLVHLFITGFLFILTVYPLIEFFPNKAECYQKIPSKKWLKYYQRILYVWCLKCYWWITSRKTFNPICPGVFLSDHAPGGRGAPPPPSPA